MMLSRRAPSATPTSRSTYTPSSSGPRWISAVFMSAVLRPSGSLVFPQIPHIGRAEPRVDGTLLRPGAGPMPSASCLIADVLPRIALVHDYLLVMRGAERTFAAIADCFPEADIFTLLYDREGTGGRFDGRRVGTSY